jgi:signal transduction histidine kinase
VDGDIRDNIQAPDKEHMSSLEEDTSQKQKDREDFPEPRVVFCPWWSPHCLAQKLHLETPRPDEQLYYVFDRAHPGSPWGLAQRFDLSPSHDGVDGVLYVGQKFAMSDVERRLLQIAFWSLGASFVIAPAIGFVVSRRMLRRVEEVNAVCDRVQRGDLAARASHETAQDEFGELSRHVNSMLDQIHNLVHGLRDVSNRIAHDLRTPIARLKAKIEDAADAPTLEAAQAGAAAAAAETQEILETFQALLDIAEVEAGADGGLQPVQLDDTIRSAIDLYGVVAEEAGVRLAADLEPAAMFGEPSLLVRLVANLVDNAIKFSPRGGEVRVSVMRRGGDLALQVQDRGPGVPAEDRESVMRRFVRGAATRATPGHGLGLALVAAVAKRHGARIEMDDAGPGLIVRVLFKAA